MKRETPFLLGGSYLDRRPMTFGRNQAHWWSIDTSGFDEVCVSMAETLLDHSETNRISRVRRVKDRVEAIMSRALLRLVLSQYGHTTPRKWRFEQDAFGRPFVAYPPSVFVPSFNVSHSRGYIHCLVTRSGAVGVDVEFIDPSFDYSAVMHRVCSASEIAHLQSLRPEQRLNFFYALWVVKEAYIKALGGGLSLPVDQIEVLNPFCERIDLRLGGSMQGRPEQWDIRLQRFGDQLVAAAALQRSPDAEDIQLMHFSVTCDDMRHGLVEASAQRSGSVRISVCEAL
ncbi:4'-phosphopantetheinyl transferase family protein [Denitromonas iodatirespirans]|uniref:4'-phosphopantetheinyl transferase superfamily protein n=1 Tax=Denitromonas iodatirespirans TaxID=2795389 RepID=A0A944DEM6_DENI1|nr:4'-phosphopantetheinyl transferase superfamily protein [Denitromonas iodatirespirans]MBT0964152.1 4'-phosphopantetheinyl transferase superfamily protein [Denitromonas iodatirespirans]